MYTVNITFKIPQELFDLWQEWMKKDWQPKISESCTDASFRLSKLLGHDDESGITVVFQIFLSSRALLNLYHEKNESKVQELIINKWGEKVLFFQTVLEQIDP